MRKKPEERKKEILDAADLLFAKKGYDEASTNDILEAVGISRGAMYHHFKSKEEIMDSLIERYNRKALEAMKLVADDRSIPVVERLAQAIMAANIGEMGGAEILRQVHRPQNALMHEKMQRAFLNDVPPILTEIIKEGIEQGFFQTEYPYECVEIMMIYINVVFDRDMIRLTAEEKQRRLEAFLYHMEKLLGAHKGSLKYIVDLFGGVII